MTSSLKWLYNHLEEMSDDALFSASKTKILATLGESCRHAYLLSKYLLGARALDINVINRFGTQERINGNQLTILPAGWQGHAVGLALFNPYLIVTNPGEGSDLTAIGSYIYKIGPAKITPQWLAAIAKGVTNCMQEQFQELIQAVILPDEPIYNKHAPQKAGNCSVSNPKKMIEEIIVCLSITGLDIQNPNGQEKIKEKLGKLKSLLDSESLFKKITSKLREYSLQEYQEIRKAAILCPDPAIQDFIKNIDEAIERKREDKIFSKMFCKGGAELDLGFFKK